MQSMCSSPNQGHCACAVQPLPLSTAETVLQSVVDDLCALLLYNCADARDPRQLAATAPGASQVNSAHSVMDYRVLQQYNH